MQTKKFACAALGVASLAALLSGCGGGSSSGNGTSTTGTAATRATILLTDSPREDYAHIWATIYHVELTPSGGGAAVVAFDNPTGVQVDLKTLRDATGARYNFLSSAGIPAGTYTGVSVTIGATLNLIKTGDTTAATITVDTSVARDANGNAVLSLTFQTPKTIAASTAANICLDFDLSRFIVQGSKLFPALAEGSGAGLADPTRHDMNEYRGAVSGLTGAAPVYTFTLTLGRSNQAVTVTTTASTALFGTMLANGANVAVEGTLDTTAQTLVATEVEVRDAMGAARDMGMAHTGGVASALDSKAGTFTLTPDRIDGFPIRAVTIGVATTATTVYRDDTGATVSEATFFTALATTPQVGVVGTYDDATKTVTATELRVFDPTKNGSGQVGGPHPFRDGGPNPMGGDPIRDHGWGNGSIPPPPAPPK